MDWPIVLLLYLLVVAGIMTLFHLSRKRRDGQHVEMTDAVRTGHPRLRRKVLMQLLERYDQGLAVQRQLLQTRLVARKSHDGKIVFDLSLAEIAHSTRPTGGAIIFPTENPLYSGPIGIVATWATFLDEPI